MKSIYGKMITMLTAGLFAVAAPLGATTDCKVEKVASLPLSQSGHTGTAGAFVGTVDGRLIIAAGSDFPEAKPWQDGNKVYYDDIYVLTDSGKGWSVEK